MVGLQITCPLKLLVACSHLLYHDEYILKITVFFKVYATELLGTHYSWGCLQAQLTESSHGCHS